MQLSAEIRWFWKDQPPPGLRDWFADPARHAGPLAPATVRVDRYVRTVNPELGIKLRGETAQVEVKGLVRIDQELDAPPFQGPTEIWSKWSWDIPDVHRLATIAVRKQRWQRLYAAAGQPPCEVISIPDQAGGSRFPRLSRGCFMELTEVSVNAQTWWTFGFEAFGELGSVVDDVMRVATQQAANEPLPVSQGRLLNYPAWINAMLREPQLLSDQTPRPRN